ncbi:hypothetical protein CTEN210_04258 [Chaetoceros tenuissimus]|uniref:Pentacotripeptide-repeat region of PRORP domain-containing protein n=1 Tax=Chaetoceros tenuissimus TaxID=426638 RepID=A0AAD3CKV6_9STRA|nr:hypothetical protein CTEN210_04258 [Chaetoceros tenuissimus]
MNFKNKISSRRSSVPRSTSIMNVLLLFFLSSTLLSTVESFTSQSFRQPTSYFKSNHQRPLLTLSSSLNSKKHQHEEPSKRRKPQNNKVAMKWVVESIEKILHQELKQEQRNMSKKDEKFLHLLYSMPRANSKQEANRIEKQLLALDITSVYSHAIQERVMKAVSMAGYVNLSLSLLESMLDTNQSMVYVPSYMAYTAVLNRLRKWKRIDTMRELMQKLSKACDVTKETLDIVALNTYISALCDVIPSSKNDYELVQEVMTLLKTESSTMPKPDVMTFNIALNLAANLGNETLVNDTIHLMKHQGILPDIVTYNAMLKAAPTSEFKAKVVDEILEKKELTPDRFTIELALIPLVDQGRIADLLQLLQTFRSSNEKEYVLQNAFSTYLLTLVKAGEVDIARAIFDTCLLSPSLEQADTTIEIMKHVREEGVELSFRPLKPITRHFNALFEGYKMLNDPYTKISESKTQTSPPVHCLTLFQHMKCQNVLPDSYSTTLLMSLQKNSKDITNLFNSLVEYADINLDPPIYHSLMMAYGSIGDASSVCHVFDHMLKADVLAKSLNSWNVFLTALSKSCIQTESDIIDCEQADAKRLDLPECNASVKFASNETLVDIVKGHSPAEASKLLLELMVKSTQTDSDASTFILRPNGQTFCLVASALSHSDNISSAEVLELYKNAIENDIVLDGRFLNALLRCYGDDIQKALQTWKTTYRLAILASSTDDSMTNRRFTKVGKSLIAAYHGLMHVAGKAYRPDIALRIAYAMTKEGLEPTEAALNAYNAGVRLRDMDLEKVRLHTQYEKLLLIECSNYCPNDKRKLKEKRVRIII